MLTRAEQISIISNLTGPPKVSNGVHWAFYPSGTLKSQTIFAAGQPHGSCRHWHPNERLWKLIEFTNGIRHGCSTTFGRDGKLEQELRFDSGRMFYEARYDDRGIRSVENWYGDRSGKN